MVEGPYRDPDEALRERCATLRQERRAALARLAALPTLRSRVVSRLAAACVLALGATASVVVGSESPAFAALWLLATCAVAAVAFSIARAIAGRRARAAVEAALPVSEDARRDLESLERFNPERWFREYAEAGAPIAIALAPLAAVLASGAAALVLRMMIGGLPRAAREASSFLLILAFAGIALDALRFVRGIDDFDVEEDRPVRLGIARVMVGIALGSGLTALLEGLVPASRLVPTGYVVGLVLGAAFTAIGWPLWLRRRAEQWRQTIESADRPLRPGQ